MNVYLNEYGLFGDMRGKHIKIFYNERTSKYLLSFNYIPANFDGILIGSSVSANINTENIEDYSVYNASIVGANITELGYLANNIMEKGIDFIIICLSPYITKNHGRKTSYIEPREYWGTLGSLETVKLYTHKLLVSTGLREEVFNAYGLNNFTLHQPGFNSRELIQKYISRTAASEEIVIDDTAYSELDQLLRKARNSGVRIFGYYHPYHYDIYQLRKDNYREYQNKVNTLFREPDVIWDFNSEDYLAFRKDYRNFSDRAHLSPRGADFIAAEINRRLLNHLSGQESGMTGYVNKVVKRSS